MAFQIYWFANGGNHAAPAWDTLRDAGKLMVLDAMTGSILAIDTMPDGEENLLFSCCFYK